MSVFSRSAFIDKHYWIHALFWTLYSVYLFANPAMYKWGWKPVAFTGLAFYLSYGGAYFFAIRYISPRFFEQKKIGRGLLMILLTVSCEQAFFWPISNYFLPFNNPFVEWFLFNLPFGCIVLLLAVGVSVFTDYLYVVRKVQQLEIAKAQQEIYLLKSQINPHFLFNTLNSLYVLARSKSAKTETAILQLSDLMRYLIEISQRDLVNLTDELRFLNSYVEMEKLRLNEDAKCIFSVLPNNYDPFKLPPLILLPFVENAFKHGAELNPGAVNIEIYVAIQDGWLYFDVANTAAITKPFTTTGTGLENVKKRLELILKDRYFLESKFENGQYSVKLKIKV